MNTIKTRLVTYSLDTSSEEYKELLVKLKDHKPMHAISSDNGRSKIVTGEIELDCKCLFDNQWNTTSESPNNPDCRVFDWWEAVHFNNGREITRHKAGHYLEITDEMRAIRDNKVKCGYCGHMEGIGEHEFCPKCLGSSYLSEDQLNLLRLKPISWSGSREPLTDTEKAELLPLYVEAQTKTRVRQEKEAREKELQKINNLQAKAKEKADRLIEIAEAEYKGMLWLYEHDVNTNNCIFYNHTGVFNFGWRNPLSESVKSALLDILVEFPYDYTIEGA